MMKLIYRGFKDILPENIEPTVSFGDSNLIGNNLGYFSSDQFTANAYGFNKGFVNFGISITYKYFGTDPFCLYEGKEFMWEDGVMKIFSDKLKNIFKTNTIERAHIGDFLFSLGYDSVVVVKADQRSDDLFAVQNCNLISPISFSVATRSKNLEILKMGDIDNTEEIYNLIYSGSKPFDYYPVFNIPWEDHLKVSSLLKNIK